jgi:hypothetical protein
MVRRLRARREEIVEAIFARVREAVSDPLGAHDVEYVAGLRAAVAAAFDYSVSGIAQAEEPCRETVPDAAVAQARRAARGGVSLDRVLLRYTAGYTLLGDFVVQEAERSGLAGQRDALRGVLRVQAALLERLTGAVVEEYRRELGRIAGSPERARGELVRRLLAGARIDAAALDYDFDAWHLGVIAMGDGAARALRGAQTSLRCRLLSVARGERTVWAWLGGRRSLDARAVERALLGPWETPVKRAGSAAPRRARAAAAPGGASEGTPRSVSFALGEPAEGIEGWRATHRQARDALRVALHSTAAVTRFADVALLAPWLADPARARVLVELYLAPLERERDGGDALRGTLRAYFAAAHNVNATAAALGVDRSTVRRRVRAVEQALGCPLQSRQAGLEVALRLEELHALPERAQNGVSSVKKPSRLVQHE